MVPGGAIAYITSTGGVNWKRYGWEYKKLLEARHWEAMTAELGKTAPADGFSPFAYVLSKRCMNAYAASKMVHFAEKGIRVNVLLPASTNTGMRASSPNWSARKRTSSNRRALPAGWQNPEKWPSRWCF